MTDRDPTDPRALGRLVATVLLLAEPFGAFAGVTPSPRALARAAEAQEQAANALFSGLLRLGCLTPEEHEGAFLEDVDASAGFVDVRLTGLGWLRVTTGGETEVFPEA